MPMHGHEKTAVTEAPAVSAADLELLSARQRQTSHGHQRCRRGWSL